MKKVITFKPEMFKPLLMILLTVLLLIVCIDFSHTLYLIANPPIVTTQPTEIGIPIIQLDTIKSFITTTNRYALLSQVLIIVIIGYYVCSYLIDLIQKQSINRTKETVYEN